jgi:DNA integrity scanning protein DisA with diadenylate cyclase activity
MKNKQPLLNSKSKIEERKNRILNLLEKYKEPLERDHWNLTLNWGTPPLENAAAWVRSEWQLQQMTITINPEVEKWDDPWWSEIAIIHEYIHSILAAFDKQIENIIDSYVPEELQDIILQHLNTYEEKAVTDLARIIFNIQGVRQMGPESSDSKSEEKRNTS